MPVNVNKIESAVPIGPAGTTQQVRNIQATVLINGVPTPVLMQVVSISDQFGNPVSYDEQTLYPLHIQLLADMRRETMILNELVSMLLANTPAIQPGVAPAVPQIDLDREYRSDPSYNLSNSSSLNQ
jgi:hypothetical protein